MALVGGDELRVHLLESRLCGDTATTRENAVHNAHKLVAGDPDKSLGLDHPSLDITETMEAVAALCGCSADPDDIHGPGFIDPERTLAELEMYARRLRDAVRRSERLLVSTGHPTGPLPFYLRLARALEEGDCKLLRPLDGERLVTEQRHRGNRVRFIDGVGVLADGASLYHTHASWPMEMLLDVCDPDLVLADHGFAGAAISRGIETLALNDINDPSIAVAKARGMTDVVVPLDDNVATPGSYVPLADWVVRAFPSAAPP